MPHVIVWDLETVPDIAGYAAANGFCHLINRSAVQSNHRCHSQNAQAIKIMAA